jgi:malate dehydrogenase (oxaloacetate-decarboxylating)(NADP+)
MFMLAAQAMAELNRRPIVMPLSNPTSQAECTFAQALQHCGDGLLFASGSPFEAITSHGVTRLPTQANNACAVLAPAATVNPAGFALWDDVSMPAAHSVAAFAIGALHLTVSNMSHGGSRCSAFHTLV